jgi:cobalt-zinc-cadmium efflux system protein
MALRLKADTTLSEVGSALARGEHVTQVHDRHVWELAPGHPQLTAHVLVEPGADCHAIRRALEHELQQRFGITHSTLQVDHAHPTLSPISPGATPYRRVA